MRVIESFGKLEGLTFDEEQYRGLRAGDSILVRLDGEQPEVREFTSFGLRSPLIATAYRGVGL